jgi:DNA-directed RNA polymerase specialized sigma24 family protein
MIAAWQGAGLDRLHDWLCASTAEIAVRLGVAENTVTSYLHLARRLRRATLPERGFRD